MPKVSDAYLEARRAEILDAAWRCLADKGYHQTTMQDVCEESGLSYGAIYRYFASKEDILIAIFERIAEEEKIDVSDEEIDREVEALAKQSKQTSEAIRARLTRDGALDRIRNRIRNEKTLDFLYHQSA